MKYISILLFSLLYGCNIFESDIADYEKTTTLHNSKLLRGAITFEQNRANVDRIIVLQQTKPYFFNLEGRECVLFYWKRTDRKSVVCYSTEDGKLADHYYS